MYRKERYEEAIIELTKTLKENPDHTGALEVMGNICFMKEKYGEAISYFLKAEPSLEGKENRVYHFYMLGNAYLSTDQFEKAIDVYQKGIASDPDRSLREQATRFERAIEKAHRGLSRIKPFKLDIDQAKIREVMSKNLLGTPSQDFSNYSLYGAKCLQLAQSLRQRTLGMPGKITEQEMREDSIGVYFAMVESNLLKLANSLCEAGGVLGLKFVGSSDSDIEDIMNAARKCLHRTLGVSPELGTDTTRLTSEKKISAYVVTHEIAPGDIMDLYNQGVHLKASHLDLADDFLQMLSYLRRELETANKLFGRS